MLSNAIRHDLTDNNYSVDEKIALQVASAFVDNYYDKSVATLKSGKAKLAKPSKVVNRVRVIDDGIDKSLLHVRLRI